jgi:hypothetical protein
MKTDDLIRVLSADSETPPPSLGRIVSTRLLPGVLIAIGLYFATLGVRPHLAQALESDPRVLFKIALMLLLLGLALPVTQRLVQPGAKLRGISFALLVVPLLLGIAVVFELGAYPESDWGQRLFGHNALICMMSIPFLALAPLGALMFALRYGAPSQPGLAGAAAGLLAGAIGAALYATHCPDDSPLFVATWYVLGLAIVTGAGAAIGGRLLRW